MKGFKMPGDLGAMMKQAQKLQQEVQRLQEQAKEFEAESSAGGGMVVAVANGKNQLVSLKIDKAVVNPSDIEMLQDLIIAAANEALKKVQERTASEMKKLTGGLGIPGL